MDKPCKKCEGKGGRQTKPFWITAFITCEPCGGTGIAKPRKRTKRPPINKKFGNFKLVTAGEAFKKAIKLQKEGAK